MISPQQLHQKNDWVYQNVLKTLCQCHKHSQKWLLRKKEQRRKHKFLRAVLFFYSTYLTSPRYNITKTTFGNYFFYPLFINFPISSLEIPPIK